MKPRSPKNSGQLIYAFKQFFWPIDRKDLRFRVVISFCLLIASKALNVYIPFLYKNAIDKLSQPMGLLVAPIVIIISYCVAKVLAQLFSEIRDIIFSHVTFHAVRHSSKRAFEHLHKLSLRFHLERKTGSVARAIEKGSTGIENILSFLLFNIVPTIIEILLVCGILLYKYNIIFAAITFSTMVLYITFTLIITNWRDEHRRVMNKAESEASGKAVDSLLNYETVKYFGNEQLETDRFDSSLIRYQEASIKSQKSLSVLNIGQGIIIALGLAGVMILSAKGVLNNTMTVGDFVLVNTFLTQLYVPLHFLGYMYRLLKQSLIDMENMNSLLNIKPEVEDIHNANELQIQSGEIRFEGVKFHYDNRIQVIHDLTFTIPSGKTVAIVGSSGAGKSTLSRLLYRFYDTTDGKILIDGTDITTISQASLRRCIGIVPQDTVLFNDSILYNIQYGNPNAPLSDIKQAAKLAQIDKFIEKLPDGYNTMVGERGLKLSGGEKQRIAIARVILKNTPILIFDEATSALDVHTEKEIQKEIFNVARNKTTLIIAHRLSTIVDADEILVLDKGRVAEQGTHRNLLERHGLYADMWNKQQQSAII